MAKTTLIMWLFFVAGISVLFIFHNTKTIQNNIIVGAKIESINSTISSPSASAIAIASHDTANGIVVDGESENDLKIDTEDGDDPGFTTAIVETKEEHPKNEDNNKRPWLVLHVGPPKTGTTTIQDGLDILAPDLASNDNVFYVGAGTSSHTNFFRYQETKNSNSSDYSVTSMIPALPLIEASGKDIVPTMKWHLQQKHNIVVSCELYTGWLRPKNAEGDYLRVYNNIFLQKGQPSQKIQASKPNPPNDVLKVDIKKRETRRQKENVAGLRARRLRAIEERLGKEERWPLENRRLQSVFPQDKHAFHHDDSSSFAFDVKVVVTYRHYFQWLPSYYYQRELLTRHTDAPSIIDFIEKTLRELGEKFCYNNPAMDFTNATTLQTMPKRLGKQHGTLYSYHAWTAPRSLRDRVDIFDMHQQQIIDPSMVNETDGANKQEVLRDFVCQAIPNATSTCTKLHSVEDEETYKKRSRKKNGHLSVLDTGILTDTHEQTLKHRVADFFPEVRKKVLKKVPKSMQRMQDIRAAGNYTFEDSIFYGKRMGQGLRRMKENFATWAQERAQKRKDDENFDDGHRLVCLGNNWAARLRNASWNILLHLEALVRLREGNRIPEGSNIDDEGDVGDDSTTVNMDLFRAPGAGRPKYPLLLSPSKYDNSMDPLRRLEKDWWKPIRKAHNELFEKTKENGSFCELDYFRLFEDENFVKTVFYT
eukprot:CAMPEP_0116142772 /NCGR_PEP_ID=MMETSP0329-20121206/15087_1 /TAXON_ID=697910 /ORGANISM="Pseudo-nitzschia arenysensis, Strain B593" /LENGTH=705 /DNA_ID=CAMNT_0003638031 /DNA_START=151 /DNA_END=2268 /DNA_ORIENTATION=+